MTTPQEEPAKHKVRPDPHRVMAWIDGALQRRPIQIALLLQLVLLLSLLLGPRLWGRESATTRLRVADRAEGNIKATQNFDYYPSAEKLELARSEAAGKVLPVFDHQADLGPILLSRIGRAFNAMVVVPPDSGSPRADAGAGKPAALAKTKVAPRPPPPTAAEIEDRRREFASMLQIEVPLETFEQLRKAHFSSDLRAALLGLVGSATSQFVVAHRGAMAPFGGKPVTVRHLVGGRASPSSEERVSNLAQIKGLQEVREEVRVQAPIHVAKLPPPVGKSVAALAQSLVSTNLSFNQEETDTRREAARDTIQARPITIVRGQVIIRDGDPVTKDHLAILKAMESWHKGSDVGQVLLGLGLSLMILLVMIYRSAAGPFRRFILHPRDMLAMGVLLVGLVGLAKLAVAGGEGLAKGEAPVIMYALPVAGGAMLVRLLISAEAAAIFATVLAATCGILVDQGIGVMLYYLVAGLVGAAGVTQVQSRSTILRAGLAAGLVGALLVIGLRMFREQLVSVDTFWSVLAAIGGGLLSSFVTLALLPLMEWLFAYTTDVTLLELANLNHPLLRELILRAPGTYHHSMVVGSLSETACESIGANGLLARVACYYHDVGKMRNADYFAENFRPGDNPHNRLKPSMSALIIRSHVKDTIELMREHRIPELVIDTATQHHGKTLIEFFYHKAGEAKEVGEEVHEEDYRYPGPKPQSREAGVIMLADGVEAAARSLAEPTEDRLVAVVQRVTNSKFTDGQLDHCDLTLRDLHMIAKSFLQVLRGIYHQRPTYPWQQQQAQQKARGDETKREVSRDTARFKAVEREGAVDERAAKVTPKQPHPAQAKNEAKKGKADPTKTDPKKGKPEVRPAAASNGGQGKGEKEKPEQQQDRGGEHHVRSHKITGPMLPVAAQLAGEGLGPPAAERESTPEAAPEGNADLRRLGL
jgi:putative nucleotidyltransferase with HDIG domain